MVSLKAIVLTIAVHVAMGSASCAPCEPPTPPKTFGEMLSEGVSNVVNDAADAAKNHPVAAAVMGGGLLVAAAPAVVVAPALAVAGFGPAGIGMYTAAAWWHGTIGNAAAGSIFATLTSAGMGGAAGVAAVNGAVSGAAGAVAASGALGGYFSSWMEGDEQRSEDKKSCE